MMNLNFLAQPNREKWSLSRLCIVGSMSSAVLELILNNLFLDAIDRAVFNGFVITRADGRSKRLQNQPQRHGGVWRVEFHRSLNQVRT